jgi:hypothetical protein
MLITIAAADFGEYRDSGRVPTEARLRANRAFKASDGTFILPGGDLNPDAYQRFSITMQGARMRVEAGTAYSTTDSDQPDATYTLEAFDADGSLICNLLSRIRISNANNSTTWNTITEFSKGTVQRNPVTYLDSASILRIFDEIVNGAAIASNVQRGVLKLDVAPADLNNPIAVGINSPLITAIAAPGTEGSVQTDVAPLDSAHPIAVGANSPKVTKDLALDYGNSFATAITAIGSSKVRLGVTAPVTETADRTLPENIQLDVKTEGLITVNSGKTLTIGSLKDPGNRQIFAGAGNVRFGRGAVERFNTAWFTGQTSGASIKNALDQLLASCLANNGGRIYVPNGTWTTTGNHVMPSGTVIQGASRIGLANYATEIKMTSGSAPMFKINPGTFDIQWWDLTLNGDAQASTQGLLAEGTFPADNIVSGISVERCSFLAFTDAIYLHGISEWQIRQVSIDEKTVFAGNTSSGIRITTQNSNIRCGADFFVPAGASGIAVERVGWLYCYGNEFGAAGAVSFGNTQVESQTIVGNVTIAGVAQSVVTAAGMSGSPVTVTVPLTTGHTTGTLIATEFRAALAKNPNIASFFHIGGSGAEVLLAAIDPAANDGTMNFSIDTGTATGVTNSATSGNLQAGTADGSVPEAAINITGPYAQITLNGTSDESLKYFIKHNYANNYNGNIQLNGCGIQGRITMLQNGRLTAIGGGFGPKAIRDAPTGSGSVIILMGCTVGSTAFYAGSFRSIEQRAHNISDVFGSTSSIVYETGVLNRFAYEHSTSQLPLRMTQSANAFGWVNTDPWLAVLGKNNDQRLLRLGRADTSGFGDFYYDFYRETASGFLRIDGNQADPFKAVVINCPVVVPDAAYNATTWDNSRVVPTQNAVRDEMENRATKASPVFTGRVRSSTTTVITPGATPTLNAALGDVFTLTPGEDENISISNQAAGQTITLIILTSGATSRTITFGTGFKPSATLATGVTTGKYFIVRFFSDGSNCYEILRTAAL